MSRSVLSYSYSDEEAPLLHNGDLLRSLGYRVVPVRQYLTSGLNLMRRESFEVINVAYGSIVAHLSREHPRLLIKVLNWWELCW